MQARRPPTLSPVEMELLHEAERSVLHINRDDDVGARWDAAVRLSDKGLLRAVNRRNNAVPCCDFVVSGAGLSAVRTL